MDSDIAMKSEKDSTDCRDNESLKECMNRSVGESDVSDEAMIIDESFESNKTSEKDTVSDDLMSTANQDNDCELKSESEKMSQDNSAEVPPWPQGDADDDAAPDKQAHKSRVKSKVEKRIDLSTPEQIVAGIMAKSDYKVPNLSQFVIEKFEAPDYKPLVMDELRKITYTDTVRSDKVDISVLPSMFKSYKVVVSPFAITNLSRQEEVPYKRKKESNSEKKWKADKRANNGIKMEHKSNNTKGLNNHRLSSNSKSEGIPSGVEKSSDDDNKNFSHKRQQQTSSSSQKQKRRFRRDRFYCNQKKK